MNFLLRPSQISVLEPPSSHKSSKDANPKPSTTLEGLIAEDPYPLYPAAEDFDMETEGRNPKDGSYITGNHIDVTHEEGWITIPYKELQDNWDDAPDIRSFHALDRSFVFPGEQAHILVCLSANKEDTEIITPFKVAAVMSKNGLGQSINTQSSFNGDEFTSVSGEEDVKPINDQDIDIDQNGETVDKEKSSPQKEISAGESLIRMEDYKRQTEKLLQKFKNSHFFVRIAESYEPLWSKKNSVDSSLESSEKDSTSTTNDIVTNKSSKNVSLNTVIDRGNFDANGSGGVARNTVKCCSLPNGDSGMVQVLLQVNVGVDLLKDPVLEILQFERHEDKYVSFQSPNTSVGTNQDPCGELLKWLLPLDNTVPPSARPLSSNPSFSAASSSGSGSASLRSNLSSSSGSQLFSFGHFRSYSMSSLPQDPTPSTQQATVPSSKPNYELDDWDRFSSQKSVKSQRPGNEGLLSFRGVSLEPDRFSVRCGLEGIYIPGRRWRRKLDLIQPIEIHSFAADCNTDDLLCVQIKNVSPAHVPDIVIFIDTLTIVFEEASKDGQPLFLPLTCIEAGNDHSLPNLSLRRGEEHSFILKPTTSMWKKFKGNGKSSSPSQQLVGSGGASNLRLPSKIVEGKRVPSSDQYAILVSCRCNYTESKLFFKQPTSWRPRISRDLMISVASEMSKQSIGADERASKLPVQVLTLQASNLTSEDLTLTVLAPASFSPPPSVVSLNSSPSTPLSPFVGFSEFTSRMSGERRGNGTLRPNSSVLPESQKQSDSDKAPSALFEDQDVPEPDVIPSNGLVCSHLWLQSRIPLGCVPSQSTATIKLELLPLTDGIITLDTLQIDVKEKGLTYVPEHCLMINATSSISTGIV